jgi:hypothetical protein
MPYCYDSCASLETTYYHFVFTLELIAMSDLRTVIAFDSYVATPLSTERHQTITDTHMHNHKLQTPPYLLCDY